jgi:hypothetical protein
MGLARRRANQQAAAGEEDKANSDASDAAPMRAGAARRRAYRVPPAVVQIGTTFVLACCFWVVMQLLMKYPAYWVPATPSTS